MRTIDIFNKGHESTSVLVVSDIHSSITEEEKDEITSLRPQICLLAGDISVQDINILLSILPPVCRIYGVLGNHDTPDVFQKIGTIVTNINGKSAELGLSGTSLVGIEGSHRYKSAPVVMHTHEESIGIARELPRADILLAHDSMFGRYSKDDNKCGLKGITDYLNKKHPMLFIFGHHHIEDDFIYKHRFHKTRCICNNRFMTVNI